MKKCSKCKKLKSSDQFGLKANSKTKSYIRCITCRSTASVEWNKKNPEKMLKHALNFKISGGARLGRLKSKYNITIDEYNNILKKQNSSCAICKSTNPGGRWSVFHVDHNHITGDIRGLLCTNCNRGIGYLKDSKAILLAAANYLSS